MIPVIETQRLVLRGHRAEDLNDCHAMWSDPQVVRHIGGRPFTREEVWGRIHRYVGHWQLLGFGYWLACEKDTGRFVGEVGLADFQRDVTPSFDGAPEAGWVLAPPSHGRGFATEAMRAALDWLASSRGARRTVCMIDPENAASIRVAEKLGFKEWCRASYKREATVLFERG